MEIATARIKIKDHKEEITKIIDDTYLRPAYMIVKKEEGVYEGHAGIVGIMSIEILDLLRDQSLIDSIESFSIEENAGGEIEWRDVLDEYKEISDLEYWGRS